MTDFKTLLRMGENLVVVKEDTPLDGEPRLYVASTMADQIGASLNPAQVRLLHETLDQWLVDNKLATPRPNLEILHVRDPDGACEHLIYENGERLATGGPIIEDIDAGSGWTTEDWLERIDDVQKNPGYSDAFRAAVLDSLDNPPGDGYIE